MLASIAQDTLLGASDEAAQRLQHKRLITALSIAVLAHVVVLVVLAQPARFKLGIDRADPVITRWIELPATPSPGVAREEPTPVTQPTPKAEAPAQPQERPAKTRPTPRPARSDDRSAASPVAAAASAPASASAAASPLPEGQDPLRMLPTTPERFQMLDRLSRDIDADPSMYAPGNAISVTIDLDGQPKVWRFVIVGEDSIRSLGGQDVPALRLLHYPEHERDDRVEVWLVPQLAYRPVQMLITKPGDVSADLHTARAALNPIDRAAAGAQGETPPAKP